MLVVVDSLFVGSPTAFLASFPLPFLSFSLFLPSFLLQSFSPFFPLFFPLSSFLLFFPLSLFFSFLFFFVFRFRLCSSPRSFSLCSPSPLLLLLFNCPSSSSSSFPSSPLPLLTSLHLFPSIFLLHILQTSSLFPLANPDPLSLPPGTCQLPVNYLSNYLSPACQIISEISGKWG